MRSLRLKAECPDIWTAMTARCLLTELFGRASALPAIEAGQGSHQVNELFALRQLMVAK